MLKQHKKQLIISSVIILIPILVGLLLWNQLPDTMATHWDINGQPDSWSNKSTAVFLLPAFLFVLHWIGIAVTAFDPKNDGRNKKMITLAYWICPIISILLCTAVYGTALGEQIDMIKFPYLILALTFITVGNYLPKCSHNYTIGIKLPWTIASEANWNATHRFAGKLWLIGGMLIMTMHFFPGIQNFYLLITVILAMVLIPTGYSFHYYVKHK